jgi:hypothetical protein
VAASCVLCQHLHLLQCQCCAAVLRILLLLHGLFFLSFDLCFTRENAS